MRQRLQYAIASDFLAPTALIRFRHNKTCCYAVGDKTKVAARCFFEKSIAQNGVPETATIDKSGAINADRETPIRICQSKYLNNLVEQNHRAIKRSRPMLGFKNFRCARIIFGGIECMRMIVKGQIKRARGIRQSVADRFHS